MNDVVVRFACALLEAILFSFDGEWRFNWRVVWLFSIERYMFGLTTQPSTSHTHSDTSVETSRSVRPLNIWSIFSLVNFLSGHVLASWVRDLQSGACVKRLTVLLWNATCEYRLFYCC